MSLWHIPFTNRPEFVCGAPWVEPDRENDPRQIEDRCPACYEQALELIESAKPFPSEQRDETA